MGLETAPFISDFVATNPISTDKKRQGDDHLRLIKATLQATFPTATKAFYFPGISAKTANFTILAADMHKTFMVSTGSGEVTGTLPSLAAGDAGWQCSFIKTNTGTNAFFIAPASGTLQSGEITGLAQCRRVIPGHRCTALWDGTSWYVSRVPGLAVGALMPFHGATLPVGYELPYGQTLTSASTKYPEFYAVNGNSGVVVDKRGRVSAGFDAMGGVAASRLTTATGGVDGGTVKAVGGDQSHTLTTAQLASHSHANTVGETPHSHTQRANSAAGGVASPDGNFPGNSGSGIYSASTTGAAFAATNVASASVSISNVAAGGGTAHPNVQPTVVLNEIVVVE